MTWIANFLASFKYALMGILTAIKEERNFMVEIIIAFVVLFSTCFIRYTPYESLALLLTIGLVLVTELMNTAIETTVDLISPEYHPLAKKAKDIAAGAVLIAALIAVFVGAFIYVPRIFS